MAAMAQGKCPNCGGDLPGELGQHATAPLTGLVTCPHCGAQVRLAKAEATSDPAGAGSGAEEEPGSERGSAARPAGEKESTSGAPAGDEAREDWAGHGRVETVMDEVREKHEGN